MDSGTIPCADYVDADIQIAYFERYTQCVEVTNLFVYNFSDEVVHFAINNPGSWHGGKLASMSGLLYPKLCKEMIPPGFAVLDDSAFVVDPRVSGGKIVRRRKNNEMNSIPEIAQLAAVDLILQRILQSERQSAERGLRTLRAAFGCLRLLLTLDSSKRKRLLAICVCLLNARTRLIGLNHITTTYAKSDTDTAPWLARFVEEQHTLPP